MKKTVVFFLLACAAAAAWFLGKDGVFAPEKAQARYRMTRIERRDMIKTVSATGALSAVITVEVGSEVSGQIKELLVDFNSPVREGQVIARIDPESYETLLRQAEAERAMAEAGLLTKKREIQRYEAELENAEANWSAARALSKKTRATLENAGRNLERQGALVRQDFVSRDDYDKAQTAHDEASAQMEEALAQERAAASKVRSAKAALAVAKASVREAEAQVQLREAALDKRRVDLENTIIRSPVEGVVIDRQVDVGQTVAASLQAPTLFIIAQDLSNMQVSTSVDEADIGQVKEGQVARFTVDAFGTRNYEGRVEQIRKMGKTVQNVVTYEVIIAADNPDLSLLPGMTADVEIEILRHPQVLTAANAALRFTPPGAKPPESPGAPASAPLERDAAGGPAFPGRMAPDGRGRPDLEARMKRYTERLDLTEAQQAALRDIWSKIGRKMMAERQSAGLGPGGMSAAREKARKESQAAIVGILDARQRQLFEEMNAEGRTQQGTLWRLDEKGVPVSVQVTLGVSDFSHTEISGGGIAEGVEVISGIE